MVTKGFQPRQFLWCVVPHQGRPALARVVGAGTVQWQEGPGAGGVETLPGDVLHRALVANRYHHGLLAILVPGNADAGQVAHPGLGAIRPYDQSCRELTAVVQSYCGPFMILAQGDHVMTGVKSDRGLRLCHLPEGLLGHGVFHDMAKVRGIQVGGIEFHFRQFARNKTDQGMAGFVPDCQPAVGGGPHGLYRGPGAQAVEVAFAAGAEGGDPDIRAGVGAKGGRRRAINHRNTEAVLAESGGEGSTDHAGTDNHNIKSVRHNGFLSDAPSLRDDGGRTRDQDQAGLKAVNTLRYLRPVVWWRRPAGGGL